MRAYLLYAMLLSLGAHAEEFETDHFKIPYIRYSIGAEGSLGKGEMTWNVAKDRTGKVTPNILSELQFKELELLGHGLRGEIFVTDGPLQNTYWSMRAHHAAINEGKVRDSDYAGDNRTQEYKRTAAVTTGDKTYQIDSALGYRFNLSETLTLTPYVGLSLKGQDLRIGKAVTLIDTINPNQIGRHTQHLDSSYNARWEGINLGLEAAQQWPTHQLIGYTRYYHLNYRATADWNLRQDFRHPDSFEHSADGRGFSFGARYAHHFTPHWRGAAEVFQTRLDCSDGEDRINSGQHSIARLNEVSWRTRSLILALEFQH